MIKPKEQPLNHLDQYESKWFAVYTGFRKEKLIKKMLSKKGIECYLPLNKFTRRYASKIKTVEMPLMSCYIFVKIVKSQYVPVLETEYVVKFIRIAKDLISIPERELELIKRVVGEGIPTELDRGVYQVGDEVEVISGNLTGLKGKLVSKDGKKHFLIELETIGYSMLMTIDPGLLRKTGQTAVA